MKERHRKHANPLAIKFPIKKPVWRDIFEREAPLWVDVGCGYGAFVLDLAQAHPEWNVVGLEIRHHLVEALNNTAQERELNNARGLYANINVHLDTLFSTQKIAFVSINFPDPWFKQRHQKRRVVRREFVEELKKKLEPGAQIHVKSDYEPIALEILSVFEKVGGFQNMSGAGQLAQKSTTGIKTEREIKHQKRGDPIYRMAFSFTQES